MPRVVLAFTHHSATSAAPDAALPIVLIHGLGGTQYVWHPVVDALRAHGDVITIDLPGFGESPDAAQWTLTEAATAVTDTLSAHGVDRFVLAGHSLGGGVSIRLATTHPERVASMALVAPAGFAGTSSGEVPAPAVVLHTAWRLVVRMGSAHALRSERIRSRIFAPLAHDTSVISASAAAALARGASQGRSTIAARAAILAVNLTPELSKLSMPVELVWGREDRVVSFAIADRVAAEITQVRTHWLADVGHMPMWEHPDAVIHAIGTATKRAHR